MHHFAESLDITTKQENGFIRCIENGGMGTKADNTWRSNPAPYDAKVNLTNQRDNNILNLHYTNNGYKAASDMDIEEPYVVIVGQTSRFICLGRISNQNKSITVKVYKERLSKKLCHRYTPSFDTIPP